MYRILCALLLLSPFVSAQKISKSDKNIAGYLQQQVSYLASDELKGRRAGDPGELAAANFIASKFTEIGLVPKGDNNAYFQFFSINDGKMIDPASRFLVNGKPLASGIDFFPLSNSPKGSAKAEISPTLNEKGQPWMIDLAESFEENKNNPHLISTTCCWKKQKQPLQREPHP